MAKRKRLELPTEPIAPVLETKSAFPAPRARMPIADVAGDTAGRAALEEVAREMTAAEDEGRVVKKLPLAEVMIHHLARDRMVLDPDDMEALKTSLAARGQQAPIEVVTLSEGYGLISGLRRVEALRALGETEVLAFIRKPESVEAAYRAMIEENEMRADLSYYERANIAVMSVGQNVFPTPKAAVKGLFAHVSAPKRSKILKFVTVCEALGPSLRFPQAIPEHLGFKLAQAIEADAAAGGRIGRALRDAAPVDAAAERQVLEAALRAPEKPAEASSAQSIASGLKLEAKAGRAVLSGPAVDAAFLDALKAWAAARET
ncbi:MAG: ParB N-terminal domain-containing protein [Pseudomonadota bacterium]